MINELEALRARVRVAAADRFGGCDSVELRALDGGHSGLTWIAELGVPEALTLVVKSAPTGRPPIGRHDVLRQARVLRALSDQGDVAVPRVYFSEPAHPPFFAMERVAGRDHEPVLADEFDELGPQEISGLWQQLTAMLVRLHGRDRSALDCSANEPVLTPETELRRWSATMVAGGLEHDERACLLLAGLRKVVPELERVALLHGDYRLGNTLYEGGTINAVIDWEIWSLGDPRTDLGWLTLFTDPANFPGLGQEIAGTPDSESVLERYAVLSGEPLTRMEWFQALACFKLAAVQAHNLKRHREGRRDDDYLERFAPSITRLLDAGLEHLG